MPIMDVLVLAEIASMPFTPKLADLFMVIGRAATHGYRAKSRRY